jgi:hypothetical protein
MKQVREYMSLNARVSAMAFLTAFVTLFMQVLVHRMVSAKLLNNYAFLMISLTMLGFAFSGVLLSRFLDRFTKNIEQTIVTSASLFSISIIGVSALFYLADIGSQSSHSRAGYLLALIKWIPFALLYAVPFACAGLMLCALLARRDFSVRRIYCFDLIGSAMGALAVIPSITLLGVERSLIAGCAALLLGAWLLMVPAGRTVRALAAAAAIVIALSAGLSDRLFTLYYPQGSLLAMSRVPGSGLVVEQTVWDPLARIEVSRIAPPDPETSSFPSLLGENRLFLGRFKRMITQNNYAFAYAPDYDGTAASVTGIEETIYASAYHAISVRRPSTLIIGVGGGYDVLGALAFDAADVTAVEINRATVRVLTDIYREYFRKWVEDQRVRLVQDEGRHYLETTSRQFDIIQLSEVGTYSGTAGIGHVFTENHLYTLEAFDLYLSRLTGQGVLNMMRLEVRQPRIVLRALTTAVAALRRAGIERPADHIMLLMQKNGRFGALLVKKTAFTEGEQERLRAWTLGRKALTLAAAPTMNDQRSNLYQAFLALGSKEKEEAFLALYPFDVSPIDDNRPFFFRFSYWWHVLADDPMIRDSSIPIMEYNVLLLTVIICAAAALCIYAPLRYFTFQNVRTPHAARYSIYFAGLGTGYLAIEIALLQKFGIFLGHPNYALSVVLASLLLFTGFGALFSGTLMRILGNARYASFALAGVIILEYALVLPHLLEFIGWPFVLRAALVVSLVCPIAICLGIFMPFALEQLKLTGTAHFIPWAWGINGIFSVLSPVLSVALSITWGINALLLSAIPIYLMAAFSWPETNETNTSGP